MLTDEITDSDIQTAQLAIQISQDRTTLNVYTNLNMQTSSNNIYEIFLYNQSFDSFTTVNIELVFWTGANPNVYLLLQTDDLFNTISLGSGQYQPINQGTLYYVNPLLQFATLDTMNLTFEESLLNTLLVTAYVEPNTDLCNRNVTFARQCAISQQIYNIDCLSNYTFFYQQCTKSLQIITTNIATGESNISKKKK